MSKNSIQFDQDGNFVFNAELERQWMKLHRDIQEEYRAEKRHTLLVAVACCSGFLAGGYLLLSLGSILA